MASVTRRSLLALGMLLATMPGPSAAEPSNAPKWPELLADQLSLQVGPDRQCDWVYRGLGRFKNAAWDKGFDPAFNPLLTVSRRGLTLRVVGVLHDDVLADHGGSLDELVKHYPWLTPIAQTAVHTVRSEDPRVAARRRPPRGEVVSTTVVDLPANAVMIVYPVSIADRPAGFNTLAGNWTITAKSRRKANNRKGAFGQFPFLLYSASTGHALHGPITKDELRETWVLRRGEVSHGCNRMEGEHVVELSVLLGCGADPRDRLCPGVSALALDDERLTVMEDFDYIPAPEARAHAGKLRSPAGIDSDWVAIDVEYPRHTPVRAGLTGGSGQAQSFRLDRLAYGDSADVLVQRRVFSTWDNRKRSLVHGTNCR